MAELTTVARPYAKAAFEYSLEKGCLADWSLMLGYAAAVACDDTMQSVLTKPQLTAEQKAEAFISVCAEKLDDAGKNFIRQLADNHRLEAMPAIYILFEHYLAEQQKSLDVNVTSAYALSDAEVEKLAASLKQRFSREINMQASVDESLIGGVVIRAGDIVIDGSVRGKLAKLTHALNS